MRLTLLNLFLAASPAFAAPVFIGTNAKAIYLADFDEKTGKLTEPVAAADYAGPGFLAWHPSKPVLYAVGKPNQPFEDKSGSVAAFAVSADHKLTFMGEISSGGKDACHVAVDGSGSVLAVANYSDGNMTTIKLDEKGGLEKVASALPKTGSGPSPRQKGPHSHGVYFRKIPGIAGSGVMTDYLLEPDLGVDKVVFYSVDIKTGTATPSGNAIATAPGAGPRHMALSGDGKNGYIINELDNTILVVAFDHEAKAANIQTIPTLPADFTGKNTTAEIEVHANGRFVYGSNRGHDSIAVYSRDPKDGKLTLVQHAPCGGKTPRHFAIDPSGKWMLVGHQDSDGISVLALDPETGKLGAPSAPVPAPKPICILFGK